MILNHAQLLAFYFNLNILKRRKFLQFLNIALTKLLCRNHLSMSLRSSFNGNIWIPVIGNTMNYLNRNIKIIQCYALVYCFIRLPVNHIKMHVSCIWKSKMPISSSLLVFFIKLLKLFTLQLSICCMIMLKQRKMWKHLFHCLLLVMGYIRRIYFQGVSIGGVKEELSKQTAISSWKASLGSESLNSKLGMYSDSDWIWTLSTSVIILIKSYDAVPNEENTYEKIYICIDFKETALYQLKFNHINLLTFQVPCS